MTRKNTGLASRLIAFVAVCFIGISQSAMAAPCSEQIAALKTALTNGVCIYSKACDGLSHKLDNANRKLEKGKFEHAARKLADFSSVLENLAMRKKPKISMEDYESLMSPFYNDAAACIANGGVVVEEEILQPTFGDA